MGRWFLTLGIACLAAIAAACGGDGDEPRSLDALRLEADAVGGTRPDTAARRDAAAVCPPATSPRC